MVQCNYMYMICKKYIYLMFYYKNDELSNSINNNKSQKSNNIYTYHADPIKYQPTGFVNI